MKKSFAILMSMMLIFTFIGCSGTEQKEEGQQDMKVTDSVQAESEEKKDTVVEKEEPVTLSLTFHYEESYVQPIIEEFEKLHPNVTVEFQLNKDGDEALLTKIVGGGSTDVTLIPSIMAAEDMPQYFVELGDPEELRNKYFYGDYMQVGGKVYGCPIGVVYEGLMYNQNLLDTYYEGKVPMTLDELMECCGIMHDNGITGFCTNAGSTWPCRYWDNLAITMSENPDYANEIVSEKEPWKEGTYLRQTGEMLADMSEKGWLEKDVVTSNLFDSSLVDMAQGNIAFMLTGSWALPMLRDAAVELGYPKESMGFAPFPYKNNVSADNPLYMRISQDLFMAVNKNSQNVELAKELCAFFCERISLAVGMNEIMIDGGKTQEELKNLGDMDYVKFYTSPAKDTRIQEMGAAAGLDVYQYDGFLLDYVILPPMNGKKAEFDKLNDLWKKNFE